MKLVKVKGISKRLRRPEILSVEEFCLMLTHLEDPYRRWPSSRWLSAASAGIPSVTAIAACLTRQVVLQKLMRHANIATTMGTYGNAYMKSKREANSKIVQMILQKDKPNTQAETAA